MALKNKRVSFQRQGTYFSFKQTQRIKLNEFIKFIDHMKFNVLKLNFSISELVKYVLEESGLLLYYKQDNNIK